MHTTCGSQAPELGRPLRPAALEAGLSRGWGAALLLCPVQSLLEGTALCLHGVCRESLRLPTSCFGQWCPVCPWQPARKGNSAETGAAAHSQRGTGHHRLDLVAAWERPPQSGGTNLRASQPCRYLLGDLEQVSLNKWV